MVAGGDALARAQSQIGWFERLTTMKALGELGLVDCTPRGGLPAPGRLPTTHSLGQLARAAMRPLPAYVHAYFHDYDLLDARRRTVLALSLALLGARRSAVDPVALSRLESADSRE